MQPIKQTRSQLKRAAIISAATNAFKDNGFKSTSMDDIAKRAEVSKRKVYNHFASKEVLFSSIVETMLTVFSQFPQVEFCGKDSLLSQLEDLAQHKISLLQNKHLVDTAKVIIAETIHTPALMEEAINNFNQQDNGLINWFVVAAQSGAIDTKAPELVAMQFTAVVKAFCFWPQVIQGQAFPAQDMIDNVVTMASQMIVRQYGTEILIHNNNKVNNQ